MGRGQIYPGVRSPDKRMVGKAGANQIREGKLDSLRERERERERERRTP